MPGWPGAYCAETRVMTSNTGPKSLDPVETAKRLAQLEAREAARRPLRKFLLAAFVGVLLGTLATSFILRTAAPAASPAPPVGGFQPLSDSQVDLPETAAALAYAQAVQENDVEAVMSSVAWIAERRAVIDIVNVDAAARETALDALRETLTRRGPEGNQISAEGIEDQYLFQPGATIEAVGMDEGRQELEQPTARRIWLRVSYPSPTAAPLDMEGRPVRALHVGVNLGGDGQILKANVIGNLDLDFNSISVAWPKADL